MNEGEGGIAAGLEFAMSQCDAKYITIAHQDDIYEPAYAGEDHRSVRSGRASLDRFFGIWRIAKWSENMGVTLDQHKEDHVITNADQRIFRQ